MEKALLARATGGEGDPATTALAGFGIGAACLLPLALAEGVSPYPASLATTAGGALYLGAVLAGSERRSARPLVGRDGGSRGPTVR